MIRKIFLAEDDLDDTELFSEAIKVIDPSIDIVIAGTGQELIRKLQQEDTLPQLIFLDINMPEMNGWECLENIKLHEELKDIPVIMYSTSSTAEYCRKAIQSGAVGFYEKPVSFKLLESFLKSILSGSPKVLRDTLSTLQVSSAHNVYIG